MASQVLRRGDHGIASVEKRRSWHRKCLRRGDLGIASFEKRRSWDRKFSKEGISGSQMLENGNPGVPSVKQKETC